MEAAGIAEGVGVSPQKAARDYWNPEQDHPVGSPFTLLAKWRLSSLGGGGAEATATLGNYSIPLSKLLVEHPR